MTVKAVELKEAPNAEKAEAVRRKAQNASVAALESKHETARVQPTELDRCNEAIEDFNAALDAGLVASM